MSFNNKTINTGRFDDTETIKEHIFKSQETTEPFENIKPEEQKSFAGGPSKANSSYKTNNNNKSNNITKGNKPVIGKQ